MRATWIGLALVGAVAACGGDAGTPADPDPLPAPSLAGIQPDTLTAGGLDATLTLHGDGFVPASSVRWGGSAIPSQLAGPGTLLATVPAARLAAGGVVDITIFNPGPGGGTSGARSLTVVHPVPVLDSIAPTSVTRGAGPTEVVLYGRGFVGGSSPTRALYGGYPWPFMGERAREGELSLYLPPDVLSQVLDVEIAVENGTPGGGRSASRTFSVHWGTPVITAVDPPTLGVGTAVEVSVTALEVAPGAVLRWNGQPLDAIRFTFTGPQGFLMRADVSGTLTAIAGTASVTIWNPPPGGGESAPMAVMIREPQDG